MADGTPQPRQSEVGDCEGCGNGYQQILYVPGWGWLCWKCRESLKR